MFKGQSAQCDRQGEFESNANCRQASSISAQPGAE